MSRWAKSPKFLLRSDAVARITKNCAPGRFLEAGAGTGELSCLFLDRGFSGFLYDLGADTRASLRARFDTNEAVTIIEQIDVVPDQSLDYVFAFEVLEHIADDHSALAHWCSKLRPNGRVIVSVPAHQRLYGRTDARVGHVRRYERTQLDQLLSGVGLEVERIFCYGFPLGNIGRVVGNILDWRSNRPTSAAEAHHRSITSGVEQSSAVVCASRFINQWTLAPFIAMQRLVFATDLGDGYVARAVLRESPSQ